MTILTYHESDAQAYWREKIRQCDWRAGRYLEQLLDTGAFHGVLGEKSRLLLLTEGGELLAFCTYAQRDEIPCEALTPWVGFVYTFPPHRGRRLMGLLLNRARQLAREDGYPCVYISTDETGLYEKYGAAYWQSMSDVHGAPCRVYRLSV